MFWFVGVGQPTSPCTSVRNTWKAQGSTLWISRRRCDWDNYYQNHWWQNSKPTPGWHWWQGALYKGDRRGIVGEQNRHCGMITDSISPIVCIDKKGTKAIPDCLIYLAICIWQLVFLLLTARPGIFCVFINETQPPGKRHKCWFAPWLSQIIDKKFHHYLEFNIIHFLCLILLRFVLGSLVQGKDVVSGCVDQRQN